MWPDRVLNPGRLTYESGVLPTALRGPANIQGSKQEDSEGSEESKGRLDGVQCEEIETKRNKNNSKRAYQMVKELTSEKQGRSSVIQDKSGKCLTEEKEILSRWTEYCSELNNYDSCGDNAVLDCSQPPEEDLQPILREGVEIAVPSLNKSTASGSKYARSSVIFPYRMAFVRGRLMQ